MIAVLAAATALVASAVWGISRRGSVSAEDRPPAAVGAEFAGPDRPVVEFDEPERPAEPPALEAAAAKPEPAPPRAVRDPVLERRIETAIANAVQEASRRTQRAANGNTVSIAVHVRPVGVPGELVSIQADRALRPASNMKLVTVLAALVLLGPDWHFDTPFEAAGEISGGVLAGDLVVRAAGDPLYSVEALGRMGPWLDGLARDLRAAGIERATGALVLDEADFLEPGPGPGWPPDNQWWQESCALAGGFSANGGCMTAVVVPGSVGAVARTTVLPEHHGLTRKGRVVTVAKGKQLVVNVEARAGRVTVKGTIPADVRKYSPRFAHPDPVALFGEVVVGGLAARGIRIEGGFRRERGAPGGRVVAHLRSPLTDSLVPILRESNNAVSDQLFFATGHAVLGQGTRAGGREATARALDELGVSAEGLVQVDGSGLSRNDAVTARQLTALLAAVGDPEDERARLLRAALPVAGRSGTLGKRMRTSVAKDRIRAKTGWIRGTSALSGYAETKGGRELVFSILVAYPADADGLNTHCWKPMQDEICAILVTSDDG